MTAKSAFIKLHSGYAAHAAPSLVSYASTGSRGQPQHFAAVWRDISGDGVFMRPQVYPA